MNCFLFLNWYYLLLLLLDFDFGFIVRSLHVFCTSLLFLLFYCHIVKLFIFCICFDFCSIVWFVGYAFFLLVVCLAFLGYCLPVTMMSYWGLTVFSNILATVPVLGFYILWWLWGCEFINDFTLVKLHSLHIIMPHICLFLLVLHVFFLHFFLSSDGFMDRFCFYYERLLFFCWVFLRDFVFFFIIFCLLLYGVFIYWYFVYHEESFIMVDCLKTSDKILPEWFFLPFFGFLKLLPSKFYGVCLLLVFFVCFLLLLFNLSLCLLFLRLFLFIWLFLFMLFCLCCLIGLLSAFVLLLYPIWWWMQFMCMLFLFMIFLRVV